MLTGVSPEKGSCGAMNLRNTEANKEFTTRPLEAFKTLTGIVSSKEKSVCVCVFSELIFLEASPGTSVAKNVLENIGLEGSYCAGFREATFQNEKAP